MENRKSVLSTRYAIGSFILAILVPFLPLFIARSWDWWEAWAFGIICSVGFVITRWLAARRHPDILAERGQIMNQADAKGWDKILVPTWLSLFIVIVAVAGVNKLFAWSPGFGILVSILALIIFLAGYIFGSYALIENRFFSGMNRIQTERGHQVVSSGPYAWVRHPGYTGTIISYMVVPFLLGSWWACVPTLVFVVAGILRTYLEDRMLLNELDGYGEYAQRVRYRLIPGVW